MKRRSLGLKFSIIVGGRGSTPDPAGGAHDVSLTRSPEPVGFIFNVVLVSDGEGQGPPQTPPSRRQLCLNTHAFGASWTVPPNREPLPPPMVIRG